MRLEVQIDTQDSTLAALCRDYWQQDVEGDFTYTVSALAAQYQVAVGQVARRVAAGSVARCDVSTCESCGEWMTVTSRQHLSQVLNYRSSQHECSSCRAVREAREEAERQARLELLRRMVVEHHPILDEDPIELDELGLLQAVVMLALLRSEEHLVFEGTLPLAQREDRFAPTEPAGINWLWDELFRPGLVRIHPQSHITAFEWEDDDPRRFFIDRVSYYVRGTGEVSKRATDLEQRLAEAFRTEDWPVDWWSESSDVWRDLMVEECIAYLQKCLAEHTLPFAAGDKTRATFVDLLKTFSLGQIYSFVWRASRDAAAYWVRESYSISKNQASNTTISNIQRAADRARAEGWTVKVFGRDRKLPVSAVSHVFFTVAMKVPNMMAALPDDGEMNDQSAD